MFTVYCFMCTRSIRGASGEVLTTSDRSQRAQTCEECDTLNQFNLIVARLEVS